MSEPTNPEELEPGVFLEYDADMRRWVIWSDGDTDIPGTEWCATYATKEQARIAYQHWRIYSRQPSKQGETT